MYPSPIARVGASPYTGPSPVHPLFGQQTFPNATTGASLQIQPLDEKPIQSLTSDRSEYYSFTPPQSFTHLRPSELIATLIAAESSPSQPFSDFEHLRAAVKQHVRKTPTQFFLHDNDGLTPMDHALHGPERSQQLAIECLKDMAQRGLREAQYRLGLCHLLNACTLAEKDINQSISNDCNQGIDWLIPAAEQGHWQAKSYVALLTFFECFGPFDIETCIRSLAEAKTIRLYEPADHKPALACATDLLYSTLMNISGNPKYHRKNFAKLLAKLIAEQENAGMTNAMLQGSHQEQKNFIRISKRLLLQSRSCGSTSSDSRSIESPLGSSWGSSCDSVASSSMASLAPVSLQYLPPSKTTSAVRPNISPISASQQEHLCQLLSATPRDWGQITKIVHSHQNYWTRNGLGQTLLHVFCIDMPSNISKEFLNGIYGWIERYPRSLTETDRDGDTPLTYLELCHPRSKKPLVSEFLDELHARGVEGVAEIKARMKPITPKHKKRDEAGLHT